MPVLFDSFYAFAALVAAVAYPRSHNMFMCEGVKSLKQQQHQPYLNNTQLLPNNIVYLDAFRFFHREPKFFSVVLFGRRYFVAVGKYSRSLFDGASQKVHYRVHILWVCVPPRWWWTILAPSLTHSLTRALCLVHDPKLKFEPFPMSVFTALQRKSGQYQ